jgi:excisionase family DNA binding protein
MTTITAEQALAEPLSSENVGASSRGGGLKLLLTPEEAASALSIGRTKLYELMASGALRSVQINKCRRVPVAALEDLVSRLDGSAPCAARAPEAS